MAKIEKLCGYGTVSSIDDRNFTYIPDYTRNHVFGIIGCEDSKSKENYIDLETPLHIGQYIAVVYVKESPYTWANRKCFDAENPIVKGLENQERAKVYQK